MQNNQELVDYLADRLVEIGDSVPESIDGCIVSDSNPLDDKVLFDFEKYPDDKNVPRPNNWSGWILNPNEIEFWLDGENRIHERLKYLKNKNNSWKRFLLNP